MSRGHWIGEGIRTEVPEAFAVLAALLTRLGDPWVLAGLLFVLYWTRDATKWISVIGVALSGVGLVLALKYSFALPRPEVTPVSVGTLPLGLNHLYTTAVEADGYGFPSGHAMGSTVVYVLIARNLDVGWKRTRYLIAGTLIAIVSLTRVVLAVHFLVDVLAGIAFGLLFLAGARWLLGRSRLDRATAALGLGIAIGALAFVISPESQDTIVHVGLAIGAFTGWQIVLLGQVIESADEKSLEDVTLVDSYRATLAFLGLLVLCAAFVLAIAMPAAVTGGLAGIGIVGAVAIPVLGRSAAIESPRRFLDQATQRLALEFDVLAEQLEAHELVLFDRAVLRLAAILYVVPGLIAVESFSEPVQLPSLAIDLLDAPFALLVAGPVGVVKALTVEPLGLEWLFEIPALSEALVLVMLFAVYYCGAAVLHNGSQFLAELPAPESVRFESDPE
jgi:membrane-associated phospholipid phosphatase